jgi:hypothetical protein
MSRFATATQTAPRANARPWGLKPTLTVLTTVFVPGSIREIVPAAWFVTQIAPAPAATASGSPPVGMIASTLPVLAPIRQTAFLPRHGTQTDPKATATSVGWLPTAMRVTRFGGRVDTSDGTVADVGDPGCSGPERDLAGQHADRSTEPVLDPVVEDADARDRRWRRGVEIGGRLGDPQRAGACGDEQRGPAGERDPLIDRARRRIDVRELALREAADVRATAASCDDPGRLGERRPRSGEYEGTGAGFLQDRQVIGGRAHARGG